MYESTLFTYGRVVCGSTGSRLRTVCGGLHAVALFALVAACFVFARSASAQDGFPGYIPPGAAEAVRQDRLHRTVGWSETFESTGVSWRYLYRDGNVDVVDHQRTNEDAHEMNASEKMVVQFRGKSGMVLGHYIDYPAVVDEASPSLWLRADRPGIVFGALVVLPNSIRPDSGTPVVILVPGMKYTNIGGWQKMTFPDGLVPATRNVVYGVRGEQKIQTNMKEAYIRQLVLLVEGSGGKCTMYVDDIELIEHIPTDHALIRASERDARFDPVNLLSFRLAFSGKPIFAESQGNPADQLGTEPFAPNNPADRQTVSMYSKDAPRCSYETLCQNTFGTLARDSDRILADGGAHDRVRGGIEQVDYHVANNSPERVLAANYATSGPGASAEQETGIISGSGTLAGSHDAAMYSAQRSGTGAGDVIEFNGSILRVGSDTSYGVRAIEYQNEPLSFLKDLGFNTVLVRHAPSAGLLREAREQDMWLIAHPPVATETVSSQTGFGQSGAPVAAPEGILPYFNRQPVAADYDRVLMWDLGGRHRKHELAAIRQSAQYIRRLDSRQRPFICGVENGVADITLGNDINAILMDRAPLLTSLDMTDYAQWLVRYPRLGLPSVAYWNEIQTQPDMQMLAQCRFFGAVDEMPVMISYEQIRQQVRLSMAAGCHGLVFASKTPLNGKDHETQYRAAALQLVNCELMLTGPWFSGGTPEEILESNRHGISAIIQKTSRTGLLLPISTERQNQYVMGQAAANNVTFVAPVREGYTADFLVPGSLQKVPSARKAGGVWLELEEAGMNSLIFLTQSEWYNQVMAESAPKFGKIMSDLSIKLVKMRLDTFEKTVSQLVYLKENNRIPSGGTRPLVEITEQETLLSQTRKAIDRAQRYMDDKDYSQAYLEAERAGREIRLRERQYWEEATRNELNKPVLPVSVCFAMLPAYLNEYGKLNGGQLRVSGANRIVGGDMETVDALKRGKWARYEAPIPGVKVAVEQNPRAARSGGYGLQIITSPDGNQFPFEMEHAPIWLEVPIEVHAGELICIQGWLRIPRNFTNSVDGVTISEDHGGDALALRFRENTNWRPFAFYRYAAYDGTMKIKIAVNGYGELHLDDISANVVTP